jgi:hypothetical protein
MMARLSAWGLCSITMVIAVARLTLAIVDPASSDSSSGPNVPGGGVPVAAFEAFLLIMMAVIGAVIASRQPRNAVGWIFCVIPLSLGLLILSAHAYWALALGDETPSRAALLVAWLGWVWVPAMIPALTLFPLLFPTGRPLTPRWRPVVWLAVATLILNAFSEAFKPGRLDGYPVDNPFGGGNWINAVNAVGGLLMIATTLASFTSLVLRFRRSHGIERQQLKWVTTATVLFLIMFLQPFTGTGNLSFTILLFGLLIIACGVAVAMLRYRLYDIDVVINRTLVYGSLTATLAAVYLGSVLLLQLLFAQFTQGSGLAVAASTLAAAALVRPARARIQGIVDRRFFRRRYDATQTLERFGARLRDEVDLETLKSDLRSAVSETMQPAHVTLWLRAQEKQQIVTLSGRSTRRQESS